MDKYLHTLGLGRERDSLKWNEIRWTFFPIFLPLCPLSFFLHLCFLRGEKDNNHWKILSKKSYQRRTVIPCGLPVEAGGEGTWHCRSAHCGTLPSTSSPILAYTSILPSSVSHLDFSYLFMSFPSVYSNCFLRTGLAF